MTTPRPAGPEDPRAWLLDVQTEAPASTSVTSTFPATAPNPQPVPLHAPVAGAVGASGCLGVMGGGQLGRMWVHAAQSAGFRAAVLEPDPGSPAGAAADYHIVAGYEDSQALAQLAQRCAAVTTEFENVPADTLRQLLALQVAVSPPPDAVQVCQHRAREKALFKHAGVPCAPHALISSPSEARLSVHAALLPGILKTASLGYDGKGQQQVKDAAGLLRAFADLGGAACVLEKLLPLHREISVIVARGSDGFSVNLPVQQNLHRNGILAVTQVPAPDVDPLAQQQAVQWALQLAQVMNYVGVLCVEFFVLEDGSLVANEMAPRPHNSGHYSVDACDVSQFQLQLRCLAGQPLVQPRQHSSAVMLNLLGDLWWPAGAEAERTPNWAAVLALPGVHLHLYGKAQARHGRKMGHITVTAAGLPEARQVALNVAALLGLAGF